MTFTTSGPHLKKINKHINKIKMKILITTKTKAITTTTTTTTTITTKNIFYDIHHITVMINSIILTIITKYK